MKGELEMSAMGEVTFFLGLQVKQLPDGIFISQDKYVKDMLKQFDMESVRTATTPYEVPKHKSKDEPDDAVNVHLYRSMIGSLLYLIASSPDIMFAISAYFRHQVTLMSSHLNAVKKIFKYPKGQPTLGLWYPRDSPFQLEAYSDSDYVGSPILLVVPVFLLVVLVPADGWIPTGSCTIPTGSGTIPTSSSTISTGSCTLPTVKQFWATATIRTLEAGPSDIIATIDGNEVVVTESLIRTLLNLNDVNGLYEFTLHDVLDGMREIGTSYRWTTDSSPRPTFDFTAKLFSNMKLNWDGPHMPILAPMLVVPAGGDGADAVAAGAATVHDIPLPPPPPIVPLTYSSFFTPGPSIAAHETPVKEPTPSPVREPTPFWEPTPDSPRPHSPPPYPRSKESNEALQTPAATAAGGAEDSAALIALSLKLDRGAPIATKAETGSL
nr:ribonuclease H-like domain, reverse transcriptase, RNA-dependent DNA polymerase [Tanacetum cinerariifolium]